MFKSLSGTIGYLTVGTSPVRLTANQVNPAARIAAHTIFLQQHPTNTGLLYLIDGKFVHDPAVGNIANITTGIGVLDVLAAPVTVSIYLTAISYMAFTIPYAPGGFNVADYYVMSNAGAQLAIASYLAA